MPNRGLKIFQPFVTDPNSGSGAFLTLDPMAYSGARGTLIYKKKPEVENLVSDCRGCKTDFCFMSFPISKPDKKYKIVDYFYLLSTRFVKQDYYATYLLSNSITVL